MLRRSVRQSWRDARRSAATRESELPMSSVNGSFRTSAKPTTLPGKVLWLLLHRPGEFLHRARSYRSFLGARIRLPFWAMRNPHVRLGKNVRIQRLSSLLAEKPRARIQIGDHSIVPSEVSLEAYGEGVIHVGVCGILGGVRIAARHEVRIGDRFVCSWNVFIQDFDPHPPIPEMRARQTEATCSNFRPTYAPPPYDEQFAWAFPGKPIIIGDDVWVGANSTILKGAQIGDGCIVAAGAVIPGGTFPKRSVIAGNPGRVVKTLEEYRGPGSGS